MSGRSPDQDECGADFVKAVLHSGSCPTVWTQKRKFRMRNSYNTGDRMVFVEPPHDGSTTNRMHSSQAYARHPNKKPAIAGFLFSNRQVPGCKGAPFGASIFTGCVARCKHRRRACFIALRLHMDSTWIPNR